MKIPLHTIQRRYARGGFTIIETLIAITVLMIAIAGPLVIATRGLNSASASKNQMIASYLAQESVEMVKNKRDANISAHQDDIENWWLSGFDVVNKCNSDSNSCDIDGIDDDILQCDSNGCQIYYSDTTGYRHTSSGTTATLFYRHFYFEDKGKNNLKSEKLLHVIVDWKEGTVPYQVSVTSQLVATGR
jgi:Tfp pilus assembly protein PilV